MRTVFFHLLFIITLVASNALAQEIRATISGTVTDQSGAIMPNVSVTVRNLDTANETTITTASDGSFRVPQLLPGNYELRASATGFRRAVRTGIHLNVGDHAVVDMQMAVGLLNEEVQVTDAPPVIETTSSELSGIVDDKQMRDLPLNGRDFFQLTMLQPGVVPATNAGPNPWGQGGIAKATVNGMRPTYNNITIDGTDVNDPTYNIPPGGASGAFLGVEAIKEFRIVTNTMSAEYGRNAGSAISAITQSGTNKLHGSVYEFLRNSIFDAKNYFDLPQQPIPHFSRNQFGGAIGGPIAKDRTFFFVNYEGLREALGRTATATVPDALAHRGFLPDPNNPGTLTNVGVNPAVAPFLALYPLPNGQNFGDGTGLLTSSASQPTTENYLTARIDQKLGANGLLFGRYTLDRSDTENPFLSTFVPGFRAFQFRRNQFFTLSETQTFTTKLLNEFRFGFNRTVYGANAANSNPGVTISALAPSGPLGLLDIQGLSAVGNSVLFPITSAGNTFQFIDNFSINTTRHLIKFGADIRRVQMNGKFDLYSGGAYTFFTVSDFLQAAPFSYFGAVAPSDSNRGYRQTALGFFAQDDFKVRPSLVLNLGLRYEYNTTPTEARGRIVNIRDTLHDTAVTLGDPLYEAPTKMFSPRIGFAWTPWAGRKTVIRGGYGIFYDQIWMNLYGNTRWSPPYYHTTFFLFPKFPDALAGAGATIPVGINAPIQFHMAQPYAMQYNLNVQQDLSHNFAFTMAYVGARGVHLPTQEQVNPPTPTVQPDGRLFFAAGAPRLNPNFGPIGNVHMRSNSFYNGLQAKVERRSGALQFQAAYTFSRSIDDASGPYPTDWTTDPAVPQNPFNLRDNRSISSFDHTHALTANLVYELPFGQGKQFGASWPGVLNAIAGGWSVSGITSAISGGPFTVLLGFDRCQTVDTPCRPDVVPGKLRILGNPNQWYDPAGFSVPAAGFLGNAPRNPLRGPRLFTQDIGLRKEFRFSERTRLEFRSELFNVFNHPNFAAPNNTRDPTGAGGRGDVVFADASGTPVGNAGKIFSTVTTSRQIQFALKLSF